MPPSDIRAPAPPPVPMPAPVRPRGYVELGYVFAAVGALLFSTKSVAIKLVYTEAVDAATLLALRMGLALPFYLAIGAFSLTGGRLSGAVTPGLAVRAVGVGLLGYWFASYADFAGLEYISAQFERLILFTYPLFVVVFGAAFFGQPMRLRTVAAIAVSYIGLAVIFADKLANMGSNAAIGAAFVLAAAIAFAFYQLLAKPVIAVMGPRLFTCIAMTGAAVSTFVQFLLTHPVGDLAVSPRVLALALFLAIGATVVPTFFLNAALHRISPQANSAISTLSPVATIALAVLILGETLTGADIAGSLLVLAGVGWFTMAERK